MGLTLMTSDYMVRGFSDAFVIAGTGWSGGSGSRQGLANRMATAIAAMAMTVMAIFLRRDTREGLHALRDC